MPRGHGVRDPRSVDYDPAVRAVLIQAIRQMRQRKGVIVWIASPRAQFRNRDAGSRTAEERAFTRAIYYQVRKVPENMGERPDYSVKLTWNETQTEPSSHGRRARAVQVRLYRYGSGYSHVAKGKAAQDWWVEAEATGDTSFQRPSRSLPPRSTPPAPGKLSA